MLKEGHRSPAVIQELRGLEERRTSLKAQIETAGTPEPMPTLHPNLPELYRRKVEKLEQALQDPSSAAVAAAALRTLIDAILVHPGAARGELTIELRGDLAAFLRLDDSSDPPAARGAAWRVRNSRSVGVEESLVAGKRNHRQLTPLRVVC